MLMVPAAENASATRGDETRQALIRAAITIFGRDGFAAASTRAISQAAGVNQALIGYHFGGKPGLYLAALRSIADSISARISPEAAEIESELEGFGASGNPDPPAQRALQLLHRLTDLLVQVFTSDESSPWARLILREQQDPSEGFDILYGGFMHRVLSDTTRLVRRARREQVSEEEAKLLAVTIVGQALAFRVARTAVLREMGWSTMEPDEIEAVKALLRRNVAAMLGMEKAA
jgi:AcrR family transcriptional regulator